jgi:hypothetical protein
MNNQKEPTDKPTPRDACSIAFASFASAEETSPPPELERNHRQEREQRELSAKNDEEEDASSDEEVVSPGAVHVPGLFPGRTSLSSVFSESQATSAFDDAQSTIMGELAESSQEDKELWQRCQELQQIVDEAVIGTAVVENSGAGDHDQNAASSPSGRKERRLLIGAALVLLLFAGVIVGVTIPLTTNNSKDSPSINATVMPTQQSPAPTAAPTACTSMDCLAKILVQNEVADAEALQDDSTPQFLALRWLAHNDTMVLDLDSTPTVILVERYVLAVLYFATSTEGGLNGQNFLLSASSVCEWKGVFCNGDDLVDALLLGKSKHGEVVVLISKDRN